MEFGQGHDPNGLVSLRVFSSHTDQVLVGDGEKRMNVAVTLAVHRKFVAELARGGNKRVNHACRHHQE